MTRRLLFLFTFVVLFFFNGAAQNFTIEQYRVADGKTNHIKVGDKVLISFNQLTSESNNRPTDVFVNSKDTGFTRTILKARITNITENSIQFKDRSVHGNREIKLDKITGIRKLTLGKQILRTSSNAIAWTSIGLAIAYLPKDLWGSIIFLSGATSFFLMSSNDFHEKYDKKWRIRIVRE